MNARHVLVVALAALQTAACGAKRLPPPSAPAKQVPRDLEVPLDPPAAGTGRVILDANGDKAKVIEVTGAATAASGRYSATVIGLRPLCTTPCVVDMRYGSHPLVFRSVSDPTRQSEAEIEVGPRPKVFRHALGERREATTVGKLGATVTVLGTVAALTGAILWGVGAAVNGASSDGTTRTSLDGTGQLLTGIGLGGIAVGIPLMIVGRPTERPGASTEWTLGPKLPSRPLAAPAAAGGTEL